MMAMMMLSPSLVALDRLDKLIGPGHPGQVGGVPGLDVLSLFLGLILKRG
jgi:hypothetical protein